MLDISKEKEISRNLALKISNQKTRQKRLIVSIQKTIDDCDDFLKEVNQKVEK